MANGVELQQSVDAARHEAERELARAMFNAALTASPAIDEVATWFLVGIGATLALIVANLEQTSAFVGAETARTALLLLLVAGLFGILEKHASVRVMMHVHTEQEIRQRMPPILDQYNNTIAELQEQAVSNRVELRVEGVNFVRVLGQVMSIVPWYQRHLVRRAIQGSVADPLYGHKIAARFFNRQFAYAVLEFLSVVGIVFFVAMNVQTS